MLLFYSQTGISKKFLVRSLFVSVVATLLFLNQLIIILRFFLIHKLIALFIIIVIFKIYIYFVPTTLCLMRATDATQFFAVGGSFFSFKLKKECCNTFKTLPRKTPRQICNFCFDCSYFISICNFISDLSLSISLIFNN